jgi:predicted transcriptional regulator
VSKEHKEYRSKIRIYADILNSLLRHGGISGPTHILLGANLSHERLMKHLKQLIDLGLVSEEKGADGRVFKLTDKGRAFILEFKKIEKFAEAFGITI